MKGVGYLFLAVVVLIYLFYAFVFSLPDIWGDEVKFIVQLFLANVLAAYFIFLFVNSLRNKSLSYTLGKIVAISASIIIFFVIYYFLPDRGEVTIFGGIAIISIIGISDFLISLLLSCFNKPENSGLNNK